MPATRSLRSFPKWISLVFGVAVFGAGFLSNFRGEDTSASNEPEPSPSTHSAVDSLPARAIAAENLFSLFDPAKPFVSKAALTAAATRLDANQLRKLIAELAESPDKEIRNAMLPALIARWAKLDPHGALEFAFADGTDRQLRSLLLGHGLPELTRVDTEAARDFALRTETDGDNERMSVLNRMFAVLAGTDPALALRWLDDRSLVPEKDYEESAGRFYGEWAERDPVAAGASALEHPTEWSVTTVAEIWALADPEAVAAWAIKLDSPELRGAALEEIVGATGDKDGGALGMSLLDSFFPGDIPQFSLVAIGRAAFGHDVDKGLSWLASRENDLDRQNIGRNSATTVAREHPERLGDFFAAFQNERTRRKVIEHLAESWGRSDLDAAVAWARTLEAGADREAALFKLLKHRPELIAELQSPEAAHSNDMAGLARQMNAANGMAATQEWIAGLPTASQRHAALDAMCSAWTDDPLAAIGFFSRVEPSVSDFIRRSRIGQFVRQWGNVDPAAAGAWAAENGFRREANEVHGRAVLEVLDTGDHELAAAQLLDHISELVGLPEGVQRHAGGFNDASAKISHRWARRDPVAASAWAVSIEDDHVRNMATYQVTNVWAGTDPQAALEWGLSLAPGETREQALRATFDQWAGGLDTAGARAALDSAGLSESERALVLEEFPK